MQPSLPDALSFLSLPAEMRNQIYECVLEGWLIVVRPDPRRKNRLEYGIWPATVDPFEVMGHQPTRSADRSSNALSLLYTCRQIHAETKLLPYGLNALLIGETYSPRSLIEGTLVQLAQVRRLKLCSYAPANIVLSRVWLETLSWFENLNEIEVHWQLQVPPWGSEEDHISTATIDETIMKKKMTDATSAACEISFHRTVVWE